MNNIKVGSRIAHKFIEQEKQNGIITYREKSLTNNTIILGITYFCPIRKTKCFEMISLEDFKSNWKLISILLPDE